MVEHVLKTWAVPFEAVWRRVKLFEFRRNDRGYKIGDHLCLLEYDQVNDTFSGREILAQVTWMANGPSFGIPEGYCVMSLKLINGSDRGGIAWSFDTTPHTPSEASE